MAKEKNQVVGILGLGYVGLPLLMAIANSGLDGLGFDVDEERVEMLNQGKSYLNTYPDEILKERLATGRFKATTDLSRMAECDAILICVPTPLNKYREPDLSYVVNATREVAKHLREGQLVVLESTVYPGATVEVVKPLLEESGLECGSDFYIAYSPEREDPGNMNFTTSTTPKIIGGLDEEATKRALALYQRFIQQTVVVSSATTAEAVKLVENIFRAVNIGLVNELKIVFDKMGIDTFEVIEAAKTKPFGFMPFYPGPGWGGHCIPVDPFYLTWKAREFGASTRFIELAGEINNLMPDYVVERTAHVLDMNCGKGLNGANILVVGVSYKANVADLRESPALLVINRLRGRRAHVDYYDPYIATMDTHETGEMKSIEWQKEQLKHYDVVMVCANHGGIDWEELVENSNLVVDTRNATREVVNHRERVFKA